MTIGERVLMLIKDKGMTQKDFSGRTGIPQSTMSSWKSRGQNPGMDKLQIICDTLDVDPYYLVSGTTGENRKTVDFIRVNKEDREYDLVVDYRELDEAQRNRLIGYLQALKSEKDTRGV